ncbi:MAG: hypothetical protein Q9162_002795 [Coniocarpon cinnabarinum]
MSNGNVETNPRFASTATTHGYGADGNAGAQKGGDFGGKALDFLKEGKRQSENLRQGINSFADNAIQPSAARDADRGVSAQHKGDFRPSEHGEGHEIREGPARGTGTGGLGDRTGFRTGDHGHGHGTGSGGFGGSGMGSGVGSSGHEGVTGTAKSGGTTGTTSAGGKSGFSSDAQALMGKAKEAWNERKSR